VDPIVFTVTPPSQTTTQVGITFTVSDLPPCDADDLTTLDSLDFTLTDPSGLGTIASFTTSEPPGTVDSNLTPDMRSLTILFESAFPCSEGTTESITVVVTLNVPAGVPPGTQLDLRGDARGFAVPPNSDYLVIRTGSVLVTAPPPPVVFTLTPPAQTTEPGSQVQATFTIADTPPCGADHITTLDSLDVELSDPSGLSTIAGFSTSEAPGTVSDNLSPDMTALTLLFDSAFPCMEGATESITVVVTLNVPAGVPSGTQLDLEGDARGFADPPGTDYLLTRTGLVLVEEPPPPPPPPSTDPGGNGGEPAVGGPGSTPVGATSRGGAPAAATPVRATARFTG
jgi:hypothetical protein